MPYLNALLSILLLATCMFSAAATQAAEVWHTASIRSVYPLSDGSFVLTFESNAPTCSNPNPYKYHHVTPTQNGMTEEGARKVYAAALVAKAAALPVQINFDDSTNLCYINRMWLL